MVSFGYRYLILFALLSSTVLGDRQLFKDASESLRRASSHQLKDEAPINGDPKINGTRWAVLVAGSNGWINYRHQADVCHAYQILKKGGLKDENIVVFMYDDIAFNHYNPRPGIIINKPNGDDVYSGVPKDYTRENCTAENFLAVVMGNKSALTGGSGKVVNSGPNDYIFIYYTDHGGPGIVMMPHGWLLAKDLIETLKEKHATKSYKKMVIYLEACEAGSMFDGILPNNLSIYAVTASNPKENSYAFYCPKQLPSPPKEYHTCLGDLFSISWMEDSDLHDSGKETLEEQYHVVRRRTSTGNNKNRTSHVTRYGDLDISKDFLALFIGRNPANDNFTIPEHRQQNVVHQRDADLLHLTYKVLHSIWANILYGGDRVLRSGGHVSLVWTVATFLYNEAPEGSTEKKETQEKLVKIKAHRTHVDATVDQIAETMCGESRLDSILNFVRPQGHPLVDDWECLKSMVKVYEEYCGPLGRYGRRYTRVMANMCNDGANAEEMAEAADTVCSKLTNPASYSDTEDMLNEILY